MTDQELQDEVQRLEGELMAARVLIAHLFVGFTELGKIQSPDAAKMIVRRLKQVKPPSKERKIKRDGFRRFNNGMLDEFRKYLG